MAGMKWWGWGQEGVAFTHEDKPELAPFLRRHLELDVRHVSAPPDLADLHVPPPNLPAELRTALEDAVGTAGVSADALDRVQHARGKSLRDLLRQRSGDLGRLPDVVVRPPDEDAVLAVMACALSRDAV